MQERSFLIENPWYRKARENRALLEKIWQEAISTHAVKKVDIEKLQALGMLEKLATDKWTTELYPGATLFVGNPWVKDDRGFLYLNNSFQLLFIQIGECCGSRFITDCKTGTVKQA